MKFCFPCLRSAQPETERGRKNLIDELNADHSRGALPATEFTRTTLSMHFYDSIVAL
jgi:hypothetical protein